MKIALIHVKEDFTPVPPTGILYIGTLLQRKGHRVWIFDTPPAEEASVQKKIKEFEPDIIGCSVMTTNYLRTKKFNKELQALVPQAFFCWGGIHPSALPEETIRENALDFLVHGEGELTMVEVCDRIRGPKGERGQGFNLEGIAGVYYVANGEIRKNPSRPHIEDLDSLPIPDRSLLGNFQWYLSPPGILRGKFYYGITTMYTSRGCPHHCIFCASKTVHGSRIRRRSVDNVLEEMGYLKQKLGVKGIYFNDDTFATDVNWLADFCGHLRLSNLNMIWGCQTRADIAQDIDILKMMKASGCVQVDIGCESGSQRILNNLKKGITPEMILKSFANLKRIKMTTFSTFILGNPGETMEDVHRTEELANHAPGGVSFLILVPYPGSPLYKMALQHNWFIDHKILFDERWTNKQSDSPVIEASFKKKDLIRIRASLQNKFFFRNNLQIIFAFLRSPYFLFRAVLAILKHPIFVIRAIMKAFRKKKSMDLLEDLYQKFNEELRK